MAILTEEQQAAVIGWIGELDSVAVAVGNARAFLQSIMTANSLEVLSAVTVEGDWWPDQGDAWNDHRTLIMDAAEALGEYEAE